MYSQPAQCQRVLKTPSQQLDACSLWEVNIVTKIPGYDNTTLHNNIMVGPNQELTRNANLIAEMKSNITFNCFTFPPPKNIADEREKKMG